MKVLKIKRFDWDNTNIEHIARHNVTPDEAEEAFIDALFRKGRDRRLLVYGVTDAGRYLLVVVILKPDGVARVITARDMSRSERRYYLREKGVW
ncbi:BrnT family toxin [Syntrophaceticus schinkii]|uniref:BrnT family toxin n=1 Tax=Syntrophaceticus schinkii TaxID=499207 RepID=UPI00069C83BD|nr:BrnT family toxin [Syntrophaceticus schinkii]MDD4262511.1 BrnT family toxin [Syntrophaceticus schinkii]